MMSLSARKGALHFIADIYYSIEVFKGYTEADGIDWN